MHWGMVIDLKLCIGCNSCVIVCKAGRGTPEGIFLNKVLEEGIGKYPQARRSFWPIRCMQCGAPPCHEICPTGATSRRDDGIVIVDSAKCVGCKACILACPYEARTIWEEEKGYFWDIMTPYEEVAYAAHQIGTVQKCDFCADRLAEGLKPYCVESCLTGALIFGDLDDPDSDPNQALGERRMPFRLKEELGTEPSIFYLGY